MPEDHVDPPPLRVGQRARRTRVVDPADIERFTAITGDRNPVHYDEDLARRSRFGGIIVQGGVTSGLLNAVVAEQLPGPSSVFLHTSWDYRAPVRPGEVLTAEVEVLHVRDDRPIARLRTSVVDGSGSTVLEGEAVVYRDPVVASASAGRNSSQRAPSDPSGSLPT